MRKPLLLLSLLLVQFTAHPQRADTFQLYLNYDFQNTFKSQAVYKGVAIHSLNHWYYYLVYANGKPMLKAYFKKKNHQTKDGPYIFFFDNGNKANEGTFIENTQEGVWKYYHKSGKLKDSGLVVHGQKAGTWTSWYENGQVKSIANYPSYDSLEKTGRRIVLFSMLNFVDPESSLNGAYSSYHNNGNSDSKGIWINNRKEGDWTFYYSNGGISTQEYYKDNKLVSLECFDSTGNKTGDHCALEREPYPILDERTDFKTYMYDHITWPKELLKQAIDGYVLGEYTITRNGELIDFKITSSVHELLSKETERFFKSLKQWVPAVSHNRNIDYTMKFTIPFNNSGIRR